MTHAALDLSLFDNVIDRSEWAGLTPPPDGIIDLRIVDLEDIVIDRSYQRRVSQSGRSKVVKMIKAFSWARFGALICAEMPKGKLAIIDGQHRAIAAALLGLDKVPAVVVLKSETAGQAMDFVGINTVRTSVASIDKFRARVAAGDQDAVQVAETLEALGISTDVPAGAGLRTRETRAVVTLEKMQKRHGRGIVFTTLETLIEAQPDVHNLLTSFAVEATATVVAKMIEAERDLARLDTVLQDLDFDTLKEEAQQLVKITKGRTAQRGAELMLQRVNKGLREKVA